MWAWGKHRHGAVSHPQGLTFARDAFAGGSASRLYAIAPDADAEALVMLSDILPTGFECGVLNGRIQPGDTVAIVRAGPVGLAPLLTAQFSSPERVVMIDVDDKRLEIARQFGAT